jgi:signal transduction histidine kinase/DNA-binding response OmpR family regulator/ligand-binding sensor domain-containing protein
MNRFPVNLRPVFWYLISLFCLAQPGFSQTEALSELITHFTVSNGLPENRIRHVLEDHEGNLIVVTISQGLFWYDGTQFFPLAINAQLPNLFIQQVLKDHRGRLWIACNYAGIWIYDHGKLYPFENNHVFEKQHFVTLFADQQQNIWIDVNRVGLFRWNEQGIENLTPHSNLFLEDVRQIQRKDEHTLILLYTNSDLYQFDLNTRQQTCILNRENDYFNSFLLTRPGSVWFLIRKKAIFAYDGIQTKPILKLPPEIDSGPIQFYEDAQGCIWFSALNAIYSWNQNRLQAYPAVNHTGSVPFEDRFQNLWFATNQGLLKFIKPRLAVHENPPPKPADTQFKSMTLKNDFVFRDYGGTIWFADKNQLLFRFDGQQIQPFPWPERLGNRTTAMTQGKDGRFWFYSQDKGLIAWDGKTFDTSLNARLPAHGCISALFVDSQNRLWLGYISRLFPYICPRYGNPRSFNKMYWDSGNDLSSFLYSRNAEIWLGTHQSNLSGFSNQPGAPAAVQIDANLKLESIQNLCEDQNCLWGTSQDGIFQFDRQTQKFQTFHPSRLPEAVCRAPLADQFTWYTGDFYQKNSFYSLEKYAHFKRDPGISIYNIASLIDAPDGGVWIGSFSVGLYYASPDSIFRIHGLPSFRISSLLLDSREQLWIGTLDQGIFRLEAGRAIQTEFMQQAGSHISTLFEDRDSTLWVGTLDQGLVHLGQNQTEIFQKNLPSPAIWGIGQGQSGQIYVLLKHADFAGLKPDAFRLIPRNQILKDSDLQSAFAGKNFNFRDYFLDPEANLSAGVFCWDGNSLKKFTVEDGLPGHEIFDITETADGKIWIATYNTGLAWYSGQQFQPFIDPKLSGLSRFRSLIAANDSALWLLTNGDGMACIRGDSCSVWSSQSPLISVPVKQMKIDQKNRLILSADDAFYFFDQGNLQKIPGVYWPDKEKYLLDHFEVDPENRLWFTGGNSHLFTFQPGDVAPVIKIKSGQIGNRPFDETALSQPISGRYSETACAFEFYGGHSSYPAAQIEYAYRIRKDDRFSEWSPFVTRNRLIYTQLSPGQITEFEIRAKTPNGLVSAQPAKIQFSLDATPLYLKTWFWWLASLIFLAIFLTAIYLETVRRMRFKNEFEHRKLEADKLRELDQLKSSFFANISHEFRTPLTLILGPIEDLLAKHEFARHREILQIMQRNAQRLQRLINQLLDLSKLEAGSARLNLKKIYINHFVKALVNSFSSWAERTEIKLNFKLPEEGITGAFDPDKFEKIVTNLVSNALKFTAPGGKVVVQVGIINRKASEKNDLLELKVTDNGLGISKELHEKIFDRFFQVDASMTRGHEGTGIGLALTKELVELHGGTISLESEIGKGATFTVQMPLAPNGNYPDEVSDFPAKIIDYYESDPEIEEQETTAAVPAKKNGKTLLVVDDNADVRTYIGESLQDEFNILYAADGVQALEKASAQIPDLIISDVMMPKMDGFEFCRQIKSNIETSHIPVILLTAKAAEASKVTGLETGADDYLTKPFSKSELKARTRNLIDQRARLRKYFSRETLLEPGKIKLNSMDEEFLNKAIEIIKSNLANEAFSVDDFSKKIGLSRQQLTRKLKAVTSFSTQDFIRKIRLDCAAIYLKAQTATVTEIAFSVGFDNSAYFAKCFKEQFGCSPSEYTKRGEA